MESQNPSTEEKEKHHTKVHVNKTDQVQRTG